MSNEVIKMRNSEIPNELVLTPGFGVQTEIYDGKKGYVLCPAQKEQRGKWLFNKKTEQDCSFLYIRLAEAKKKETEEYENFVLKVQYFDLGEGAFTAEYRTADEKTSLCRIVDLHNTKRWMTAEFELEGACFRNNTKEYDIKIGVYSEVLGNSPEEVCIGGVLLVSKGTSAPVSIGFAKSDYAGNIFFNGDDVKLSYEIRNMRDKGLSLTAEYAVINEDTCKAVWNGRDSLTLSGGEKTVMTVCPLIDHYGLYWLEVKVTGDNKISAVKRTRLSKVNCSLDIKPNPGLGFSDHFAQGGKGNPDTALTLMRKAGFGINRDEVLWKHYETEPDSFVFPSFEEEYLKSAENNGIEVCYTLGKNNEAVGVLNTPARTAYEQERFRKYVRNIATELKGRVKLYSIYNEPNLALKKIENIHWYVEDLKIAYEEIKAVDSDARVLGFTAACIPYYWFEEAFRQGALNYCDIVDVHPYCWNTSPEEFDFVERINRIDTLIKKYGGTQEVWNTEFGYPVMPKGCGVGNEYLQGLFLIQTYLHSRANNILNRFYIYQMADANVVNRSNPESSFGVIHSVREDLTETPYAAKAAFVMLANLNCLISDAECLGEFFCHDRMVMVRFKKADGKELVIYWGYWNTIENELTMDFGTEVIKVYDCYGNSEEKHSENGVFKLRVDYQKLVIAEGYFTKFEDMSDYPA